MASKRFTVEEASEFLFASDNESIGEIDDEEALLRSSDNELDDGETNLNSMEETAEADEDAGEIQMVDCSNKRKKRDIPKVHSLDSALNEENYQRYEIIDEHTEVTSTIDKETLVWRHKPFVIAGRNNQANIITNVPGPSRASKAATSELECWQIFFTDEMIGLIVRHTNQKIRRVVADFGIKESMDKYPHLKDTCYEEIMALLGLLYFRGALGQNHIGTSFLFNPVMGHHVYSAVMSQNRFTFLLRCISFDDPSTRPQRWLKDRFAAFREIFEKFNQQCASSYIPDAYLSLDETLYATRQQINFKTYNKSKPARYGLLYRSICSAERPYIHFTNVYAGKPQDQNSAHYISGGNFELVNKLVDGLGAFQNLKGRNISMDRLYGAIPTARHLLAKGITSIATMNKNRKGLPAEIKDTAGRDILSVKSLFLDGQPLSVHSYVVKTKSTGLRNVLLLSTHNVYPGVTDDDKLKPYIYKVYDYTKGGVDVADQIMGSCTTSSKSNRWTIVALSHLLDSSRINGKTIFISNVNEIDSREYAWNLAMAMSKPFVQSRSINGLQRDARLKMDMFLNQPLQVATAEVQPNPDSSSGRCSSCIKSIQGQDHKAKKDKLYRVSTKCKKCRIFVCKKHTVPLCIDCAGV